MHQAHRTEERVFGYALSPAYAMRASLYDVGLWFGGLNEGYGVYMYLLMPLSKAKEELRIAESCMLESIWSPLANYAIW